MSLIDPKFLAGLPAQKNFATAEVLLANNKVDWRQGNVFKRILLPATPGQVIKFRFSFVENFREVFITLVNDSETNEADIYFPLGRWPNDAVNPFVKLKPLSRQFLKIVSVNNSLHYELIPDLVLYALPVVQPTSPEIASFAQTGSGSLGQEVFTPHPSDPDIMLVANSYVGRISAYTQHTGIAFDIYEGGISTELSNRFRDTNTYSICVNEDNTIGWAWGTFGNSYSGNALDPVDPSTFFRSRLVQIDLETGDVEAIFQAPDGSILNPNDHRTYMVYHEGKVYIRSNGYLGCVNIETGILEWNIVIRPPFSSVQKLYRDRVEINNGFLYTCCRGYGNGAESNLNRNVILKVSLTGVVDPTFHAPMLAEAVVYNDEHLPWQFGPDGALYFVGGQSQASAGSQLYIIKNNTLQRFEMAAGYDVKEICVESDSLVAFTADIQLNERLMRFNLDGTLQSTLHTYALPYDGPSLPVSGIFLFEGNFIVVKYDKIIRHFYNGEIDPTFNPIWPSSSLSHILISGDFFFAMNKHNGFSTLVPLVVGGTLVQSNRLNKVRISTKEVIGTGYNYASFSTGARQRLMTHPLHNNIAFIREQRGYLPIDLTTMLPAAGWQGQSTTQAAAARIMGDYIYVVYTGNSSISQVGAPTFSALANRLYRIDLNTKHFDTTFAIDIPEALIGVTVTSIMESNDYIYVSYYSNNEANMRMKKISKADNSVVNVDMTLAGLVSPLNTYSDMAVTNDGELIVWAFDPKVNQGGGVPKYSKTFIIIDETTMTKVSEASSNTEVVGLNYIFDDNKLIYVTSTSLFIVYYDFSTDTSTNLGNYMYLGTYGASNNVQMRGTEIIKINGEYYIAITGYVKRVSASGLVKLNINALPQQALG